MIRRNLLTDRLCLRPLVSADAPRLVEALADWGVVKWLAVVPWPYTIEDAHSFVAATAPDGRLGAMGEETWAVALQTDPDRLVGIVGLGQELGYWLASKVWGRGLAQEAVSAVLSAHFAAPDAGDVTAGWFDGNERSERVLRRLGFVETRLRTRGCLARGEDMISHEMRLTRAAFRA